MTLSLLVFPQLQKTTNGYFINHDNLKLARPQDKRRLIFYYIASQTPEKIKKEDHSKFIKEKFIDVDVRSEIFSFGGIFLALTTIREIIINYFKNYQSTNLNEIFILGVGLVSIHFHIIFHRYYMSNFLFKKTK